MFDSCVDADLQRSLDVIDDDFLSVITTLFIEKLAMDQKSPPVLDSLRRWDQPWQLPENTSLVPLPYSKQTEAIALKEYGTRKAEPRNFKRRTRPDGTGETIRTLVLGLSEAFNNLLMGIWGNLSLISLTSDKTTSFYKRVADMELTIQYEAALINAIFGYLGERRMIAKNIRLNQLIQEINGILPVDGDRIKKDILNASLAAPASENSLTTLTSNISRILRQFVDRLHYQFSLILGETRKPDKKVSNRLRIVAHLLGRAPDIFLLLDRYAGTEPLDIKKMSTKAVVASLARKFKARFPYIEISLDLARRLPWIRADKSGIQFVFNQLLENAADAMAGQGSLHIEANTLKADPARNRCVAHRWRNSIIITVSDTGRGMDLNTLLHVFDPFFSGGHNSRRLGMGMAASWGIVKAHGGYIHVRSRLGHGSKFKVFLPTKFSPAHRQ